MDGFTHKLIHLQARIDFVDFLLTAPFETLTAETLVKLRQEATMLKERVRLDRLEGHIDYEIGYRSSVLAYSPEAGGYDIVKVKRGMIHTVKDQWIKAFFVKPNTQKYFHQEPLLLSPHINEYIAYFLDRTIEHLFYD